MTTTSGPRARITPSFAVAVLALVVASGGAGYAAGQVTSQQIKDGTIQSRDVADGSLGGVDVRNGGLTGADVKDRSLTGVDLANESVPRTKLDPACRPGHVAVFGGCVRRVPYGPSSHQAAIDSCNRRGGRLPTLAELRWIATHDEYTWADGNDNNYEFSGTYTTEYPYTPIGTDAAGYGVPNASAQYFWHHCITG